MLESVVRSALQELGIPHPNPVEAVETIAVHHLRPVIEGVVQPLPVLLQLGSMLFDAIEIDAKDEFRGEHIRLLRNIVHERDYYEEWDRITVPSDRTEATALLDLDVAVASAELSYLITWSRFDAAWLTPTAEALARAICAERAYDRLPILADALEEAGCDNPDVLDHCRENATHPRGCWVIDVLLGKGSGWPSLEIVAVSS